MLVLYVVCSVNGFLFHKHLVCDVTTHMLCVLQCIVISVGVCCVCDYLVCSYCVFCVFCVFCMLGEIKIVC